VKSFEFSSKPTFLFHYAHETLFILPIRRFILGFEVHSFFFFSEVRKILFAENLVGEKRRERLHIGEWRGTRKPVIL
jgi:hypothetical protein